MGITSYEIRIEEPGNKYKDDRFTGTDIKEARIKCERFYSGYKSWDWRGAVAFVDGNIPAGESNKSKDLGKVVGCKY